MFSFGDYKKSYNISMNDIPKSTFGYNTNNKYNNFPALMSDGRSLVASHQSSTFVDNKYIKENFIKTNWQYRKFLELNSESIIKQNFEDALTDQGYYTRYPYDTNVPNPNKSATMNDDVNSIGYENVDLKNAYLSKEQLNAMKVAPQINMRSI